MIRVCRAICLFAISLVFVCGISAQVQTSAPPFGSYAGGPDEINLANLNAHFTVPIFSKPGRGMDFAYALTYDSSVWYPATVNGQKTWQPVFNWGWIAQSAIKTGYITYSKFTQNCDAPQPPYPQYSFFKNFVYHDPWGGSHPFSGQMEYDPTNCDLGTTDSLVSGATDGTANVLSVSLTSNGNTLATHTITRPNGEILNTPANIGGYSGTSATATDRNGNQISVSSTSNSATFTDTLGTTALTVSGSGTASSPMVFTYTPPNTSSSRCASTNTAGVACYTMNFTNYTVATNFGISGIAEYKSSAAVPLVTSIVLPDGSQYSFTYESTPGSCTPYSGTTCVTARLSSVTLPTGGTISYTYTGGNNGIFSDGSAAGFKRYTPDTGSSSYWNYARTIGSGAASTTTIIDPSAQANATVIQFQGIYETERDFYQGAVSPSNLLRTLYTCYNGSAYPCNSTAVTLPITQRTMTTVLSGTSNLTSQHLYKYSTTGSLTEQDDYDYGSGTVGSLLKKTVISYASLTHISAFRQQVVVYDGSGTLVSQTNYNYGDTVTATSGTPQHTSPGGSRGNLLSVNYYTQGSTYLTKSYSYFDTGNVQTVTDVNNAQTTYTYGACGNSFPTSVAEPLSLSRSMTWNCTGGVMTSVTDENGQVSSTAYTSDPYFWRPNSATDATSAVTNFTYTGQTQVEAVLPIVTGSAASDVLATVDSLGRSSLSQVRQAPGSSNFDSVETDYDIDGRPYRSTLPFQSTAGQKSSTAPGRTTLYDAIGRVLSTTDSGNGVISNSFSQNDVIVTRGPQTTGENLKKHQSQYDGMGRLTSVCEMTSATGSGSCGQTNAQTGYWTKYSYDPLGRLKGVTQNAQASGSTQTRSFTYDLMGRMTVETHAESGTTNYTYDTDTTCGTSNGDLVKKVDAVGNVTCFFYDTLHRPLSITYPSGSYAARTPNKYFVYDTATVNGVAMSYGKTRIVEAYTATTQNGTKITDTGISYTVRGERSDVYQKTPNSGSYYHVAEQFWASGALKQLSGLASLPTLTYNLDGEGRLSTVSASSGQNPVTATAYNNASLPTSITYGSSDSDAFQYDPNTDRMTQYKFNINGQSVIGNLTWNANASLKTLAITDPFNSSDTQTCSYVYDDMTRLQSAACGSVWSQTFSFDSFGNIAKSGSAAFSALYNSSTNRITTVGSFTPTYDANGNTLTDPSHSYTWDSAGKPVTIDSVGITYDAFGRMVEQNRSGVYTQLAYGPGGSKFAMFNASSLQKAMVPLMGGAQVVYNSSGILYYGHPDHLGSVRLGSTTARGVSFGLAYAPYGETYATSGSTDPAFTAQRQDTVSGIYDFPNREYAIYGRWISPDPADLASFHLTDPQSLNRYAYARNNPLSLIDPTGLDDCATDIRRPDDLEMLYQGFSFGDDDPLPDPVATPCGGQEGGGGGGSTGSAGATGSGPDPGNGVGPGQDSGTGNGSSGGDQSNNGQGCGASCGPPQPSPNPGDVFDNWIAAGIAAAQYAAYQASQDPFGGEYGVEVYANNDGTYSFDAGRGSPQLEDIDGNAVAEDTNRVAVGAGMLDDPSSFVADVHTHPDTGNPFADMAVTDFSSDDRKGTVTSFQLKQAGYLPNFRGSFLAIPGGTVLYGGPTKVTAVYEPGTPP